MFAKVRVLSRAHARARSHRAVASKLFFFKEGYAKKTRQMKALPDDVLITIFQSLSTLHLSRVSQTSKELARDVYMFLSLKHCKTFELMMESITCSRSPNLMLLLRYSAPRDMTNKLPRVNYTCAQCGRRIRQVAFCDACPGPRPLIPRRVMTRSQTRRSS